MAAFNTKTPTMDFSPFLRRDFSTDNRGGALADAFRAVGDLADGYGETADKELMSKFANETDASKLEGADFYNKLNALNAKKIIDQNKDRVYKDEEVKRQNDLNARADADYAIGVFNKEVANDALNMDKKTFDAKYSNAGGVDGIMVNNLFNQKKDRVFAEEDRIIKNNLTNLQMQNTRNQMNRQNEEYNYNMKQRAQNDIDNKFMNEYYNGTLNDELMNQYKDKVSPKVLGTIINEKRVSEVLGKYPDFATFKASEDWKNPAYNYNVKKTIYDSFGKGKETSINDQIKLEEINNNKQDLTRVKENYKKAYGVDMPISEQSKFVYKSELPEKLKEQKVETKKALPAKEAGEFQALDKYESVLNELEKAYDSSYVGGVDSSLNTVSPNWVLSDGHRKFNNLMNDVLLGKTSALTGTLSDRDMALLQASGLSESLGEKDFLEKLRQTKEQVRQMKAKNYDVLNSQYEIPDTFNKPINTKKEDKNNVNINWGNSSTGNNNGKTPVNTPIILTDEQLKNYGISFK